MLESQGFAVEAATDFNKAGSPPWWAYGKLFGSRHINKPVLKIFDKTVWIWRRLDPLIPWPGLSLLVAGRKRSASPLPADSTAAREAVPELSSPDAH